MKLSNNAIKFLMAQYRAIYKNAYFKGIASAVVLTAGLAAGTAQADALGSITSDKSVNNANDTAESVIISTGKATLQGKVGVQSKLEVSGTFSVAQGAELAIGNSGANIAGLTVDVLQDATNEGSLLVHGSTKASNSGGSKDVAIDFKKALVSTGSINVVASESGTASLTAKTLTISGDGSKVDVTGHTGKTASVIADSVTLGSGSVITLSSEDASAGQAILGKAATTYDLADGSIINVNAGGQISGASVTSQGGTIKFAGASTFSLLNYTVDQAAKAQKLNLTAADQDLTVKLAANGNNRGVLHFASGSEVNLGTGELKIVADSSKGTIVKFDSGASLEAGSISIKGGAADSLSELTADAAQIGAIVKAGKITLSGSGSIHLTGDKQVVLGGVTDTSGSDIKLKVVGTATNGAIHVSGANSTIKATNLTVADALAGVNAANLTIAADNLTLGSETYDKEASLNISGATAQNLTLKSANGFKLADNVTLSSDTTGTISGNLMLTPNGGALTVSKGNYTADSITLGSGTLTIGNGSTSDATLTVNGNVVLGAADTAGVITVSGDNSTLDISNGAVSYASDNTNKKTEFKLSGASSSLKISTESLAGLMRAEAATSGAQFLLSGDNTVLTAVGDGELSLAKKQLITAAFDTTSTKFQKF